MQPGQPDETPRAQPGPWSTPPPGRPGAADQPGSPGNHGTDPRRTPDPLPPNLPPPGPYQQVPAPETPQPGPAEPPPAPTGEVLTGELLPANSLVPTKPRAVVLPPQPTTDPEPEATAASGAAAGFRSNLGPSIAMFLLFPPFALPAAINARRATYAHQAGDGTAADDAATESRRWSRTALSFGLAAWALLVCCGGGGLVLRGCSVIG